MNPSQPNPVSRDKEEEKMITAPLRKRDAKKVAKECNQSSVAHTNDFFERE